MTMGDIVERAASVVESLLEDVEVQDRLQRAGRAVVDLTPLASRQRRRRRRRLVLPVAATGAAVGLAATAVVLWRRAL